MKDRDPASDQARQEPVCADNPMLVRQMPLRVTGRAHHLDICRGQSVAIARTHGGYGHTVASLWQVQGQGQAWRVGIDGGPIRDFEEEATAVGFFLARLHSIAGSDR
jgi:hypothetical protein